MRLRLVSLGPMLAAAATSVLLLWALLPGLIEASTAHLLLDTLDVLSPLITPVLGGSPDALDQRLRQLAAPEDLRLTVVASDGTVLADSARSRLAVQAMDNHADRPEIRQAAARGRGSSVRRSTTTGKRYVYAARTATDPEGRLYVLRLARPLDRLQAPAASLARVLLPTAAAALLAAAAVAWYLDRRLFRPLATTLARAGQLGAERWRGRLDVPEAPEPAALARTLNRLGEEFRQQLTAAETERDRLQTSLASMSEGVMVTDPDGRIRFANPAFQALFGVEGPVAGKLPLEVTRQPLLAELLAATSHGRLPVSRNLELPDGRTLTLSSAGLVEGGGAVVVVGDITEATRLAAVRRDFVANASHELKTPVAAIRACAETLRDGALGDPEVASRFVASIVDQCRSLERLIGDLLTLSRLEGAAPAPARQPVDLEAILRAAVQAVAAQARARQVDLAVEAAPTSPVSGDGGELERMLANLLDNAVQYNRPGGEVVARLGQEGDQVVVEIADTGIGIPPQALPRIFERFYRVDVGRSRAAGGTGLGLAIVKHVAQAHGGRVEVESRPGVGSTFRVRLPARRGA